MDLDRVGFESEPKRIRWEPNDCSLYALSLGAGFEELAFVAEEAIDHPQVVFPTFVLAGVMADESASWTHPGFHTGDYEVHQIVHGEQRLDLFDRVEPRGDVMGRTREAGIYDKGSGALVELDVRAEQTFDRTLTDRCLVTIGTGAVGNREAGLCERNREAAVTAILGALQKLGANGFH